MLSSWTETTYIAGPIELIGGALFMIGLFTRWSAFLASGLIAAAESVAGNGKGNELHFIRNSLPPEA